MNLPSESGICPLNTLTPVFLTGAIFVSPLMGVLQWQQNIRCGIKIVLLHILLLLICLWGWFQGCLETNLLIQALNLVQVLKEVLVYLLQQQPCTNTVSMEQHQKEDRKYIYILVVTGFIFGIYCIYRMSSTCMIEKAFASKFNSEILVDHYPCILFPRIIVIPFLPTSELFWFLGFK